LSNGHLPTEKQEGTLIEKERQRSRIRGKRYSVKSSTHSRMTQGSCNIGQRWPAVNYKKGIYQSICVKKIQLLRQLSGPEGFKKKTKQIFGNILAQQIN